MPSEIQLPAPWPSGSTFQLDELPALTWLVGPNGTGKSRFMRELREHRALASLKRR
jgi:predicted ATPase